ncbi:MAG: amidohydrolase [Hyphomicrobiales bacterium]|nr:amidohydrolase [Hyphomicrobiales bacterium]MBV8441970.1 amidohydrolase [Hyphomicrobiales bacterium]
MRTIALEEHFATPAFMEGPGRKLKDRAETLGGRLARVVAELTELGDGRVAAMDAAGVDVQALSLTEPGVEQLEGEEAKRVARQTNDALAEAVRRHPTRFFGLASLPLSDPPAAIAELERVADGRGFKGVVINGHHRGRYLDDRFFWPVLARIEALKFPVYLHPTPSPQAVVDAWFGGLSPIVSEMMAGPGWGWHIETALHVLRMVVGGVFDAHPALQIVVGHMGESLPFMIQRVDVMSQAATKLKKPVSAYLRENVHYTFSGFNFLPTFLDLLLEVGVDRIMFSTDHPYQSMADGRAFLDRLPVSNADRERIAHANAERLFGL